MYSKSVIKTILFSSMIISVPVLTNFIVDPFQQYRTPWYNPYFPPWKERYLNPGLAKNHDYDSVTIGTCLVANFSLNDLKKVFKLKRPIRLSIEGSTAFEQALVLQTALKHNTKLKQVFWGLDIFSFCGAPTRLAWGEGSLPKYLYDDFLLNDVSYLLSYDTFVESYGALKSSRWKNNNDPWYSYDKMYSWRPQFKDSDFSSKKVLKQWKDEYDSFKTEFKKSEFEYTVLKKSFDTNFKPVLDKYNDVQFVIFFPPYSILAYKLMVVEGWMEDFLELKRYLVSTTKKFKNIKFFDFQIARDVTQSLDNYSDYTTYSEKINSWILEQIEKNNYFVDESNIEQNLEMLVNQTNNWHIDIDTKEALK